MSTGRSTSVSSMLDSACDREPSFLQGCSRGSSQQRVGSHLDRCHNKSPPLVLLLLQLDIARRPKHVKDMHCALQAVAEGQRLHIGDRQIGFQGRARGLQAPVIWLWDAHRLEGCKGSAVHFHTLHDSRSVLSQPHAGPERSAGKPTVCMLHSSPRRACAPGQLR